MDETVVVAPPPSPFSQVVEEGHLDRPAGAPASVADRLRGSAAAFVEPNARGEQLVGLHGFEQRQLLVHFAGVPLRLPYDGRLDLGKLPEGIVRRVELVRGPAPISLGPTGMGGAVALWGPDPRQGDRLSASVRAAPHAVSLSSVGRIPLGGWGGLVLAADFLDDRGAPLPRRDQPSDPSDSLGPGERENRDRRGGALGLLGQATPRAGHSVDLVALAFVGAHGVPRSETSPVPRFWRFPENDVAILRLAHRGRYPAGLTVTEHLGVTLYRNVLLGYDDATYASRRGTRAFRSIYEDLTAEGGAQASGRLPGRGPLRDVSLHGWATLRLDAHRQRDDQNPSGSPSPTPNGSMGPSLAVSELTGEGALEGSLRFRGGHLVTVQLEALASAPLWVPEGGVRPNTAWHVGPLVGYGFTAKRLSAAVTLARKARLPSLRERYADAFGAQTPNPGLTPESVWHGWAAVTWRPAPWLALSAFPFAAHLTDRIERRPVAGGLPQQVNTGAATLAGVELTALLTLPFGLTGRAGYQWLYSRRSDPPAGEPPALLNRAPHQAVLQVSYRLPRRLSLSTSLRLRSAQPGQDPDTGLVSELPPCVTWHGRVEWGPHRGLRLLVAAENLLDASCRSVPGYPEPGRLLWAGLALAR